jgi:hypothetical protein
MGHYVLNQRVFASRLVVDDGLDIAYGNRL